jgi:hypothetical protein
MRRLASSAESSLATLASASVSVRNSPPSRRSQAERALVAAFVSLRSKEMSVRVEAGNFLNVRAVPSGALPCCCTLHS